MCKPTCKPSLPNKRNSLDTNWYFSLEYASGGGRVVASSNLVTPTISFEESTGRLTPCFSNSPLACALLCGPCWTLGSLFHPVRGTRSIPGPRRRMCRYRVDGYQSDYPFNGGLPILFYMLPINWLWCPEALRQIFFRNRSYSRVGLLFFCVSL